MRIDLGERSYEVIIKPGCVSELSKYADTDRKCLIVTDEGVPEKYVLYAANNCSIPYVAKLAQGEASKSIANYEMLLTLMAEAGFTRSDCVVAVGGGMAGDIAGFAAASYMRGIDFYNIPTTLLSQADSSIGGKTAVNLGGAKNIVGAFWQPSAVLIDPDTLSTLPDEQVASGMAEIIKTGMIADAELFEIIENSLVKKSEKDSEGGGRVVTEPDYEVYLKRSLAVKKRVVEEDEREGGLRRILNFGHTIGHGIESVTGMPHGYCVALGMIPMCAETAAKRLIPVLEAAGLPVETDCDLDAAYDAMLSDKKMKADNIAAVWVDEIGSCVIKETPPAMLRERMEILKGLK